MQVFQLLLTNIVLKFVLLVQKLNQNELNQTILKLNSEENLVMLHLDIRSLLQKNESSPCGELFLDHLFVIASLTFQMSSVSS